MILQCYSINTLKTMEKLIFIMSICSFLMGMFFTAANWTGTTTTKFGVKLIGILGIMLPIIYWLKLLAII